MSSNVFRCCFVDIFEEHLSSMRFFLVANEVEFGFGWHG